jgi:hypothetical protein
VRIAVLAALTIVALPLAAQDHSGHGAAGGTDHARHQEVLAPIKRLFDGMRAHDSTLIKSAFAPGAQMMTRAPREGGPQAVTYSSVDGFVAAASRPGEPWDEQIFDPVVSIDANLASVWVFYTFSLGEKFSHCGVDAIHLVKADSAWLIASIADTRRTENCSTEGRHRIQ